MHTSCFIAPFHLGIITVLFGGLAFHATPARADLDINPDLFTNQAIAATGQFSWDEFDSGAGFAGPHAPDVFATGGTAELTASGAGSGFPTPTVTGTQNLYAGSTIGTWEMSLASLSTTESNTTVVLQVAALGDADVTSFLLDGAAPTSFVDRGNAVVTQDIDGGPIEDSIHYYWAEWQLSAETEYDLEFTAGHPHFALASARVDYFNTATTFNAANAAAVPEPTSFGLIALAICCGLMVTRRTRMKRLFGTRPTATSTS